MLFIHEESQQDRNARAEELDRPSPRCCTTTQQTSREKLLQPKQLLWSEPWPSTATRAGFTRKTPGKDSPAEEQVPVLLLTRSSLALGRDLHFQPTNQVLFLSLICSQLLTGRFWVRMPFRMEVQEHRLFSLLFQASHLRLETQPTTFQLELWGGIQQRKEKSNGQQQLPPPLTALHSSAAALWSNRESGESLGLKIPGKDCLIQPPIQALISEKWVIPAMSHPCGCPDSWSIIQHTPHGAFCMFASSPRVDTSTNNNTNSIYQSCREHLHKRKN